MQTRIIEATVGQALWSAFLVGLFDHEREFVSVVEGAPLLRHQHPNDFLLLDLYTKEGAIFSTTGYAKADIAKHKIWTSLLFEPFLGWIREQHAQGVALMALPQHVEFPADKATDSCRHGGPMDALLKVCLRSTDKDVVAAAKATWTATFGGVNPPGTPLTLAEARQWLGDPPIR